MENYQILIGGFTETLGGPAIGHLHVKQSHTSSKFESFPRTKKNKKRNKKTQPEYLLQHYQPIRLNIVITRLPSSNIITLLALGKPKSYINHTYETVPALVLDTGIFFVVIGAEVFIPVPVFAPTAELGVFPTGFLVTGNLAPLADFVAT